VKVCVNGTDFSRIAVRIPGWCENFTASQPYTFEKGYAVFENCSEITISFDMKVQLYEANTAVQNNAGCAAVMRGPIVYCVEAVDNGKHLRSLRLDPYAVFEVSDSDLYKVPVLKTQGLRKAAQDGLYSRYSGKYEKTEITLIPYFAFANRGASEMLVWIPVRI